ncbi:acyl carrier protein [Desulforhabdus sp. TSK]|uniref:acyl carrier protein n=1 Tax=Desulforhabdus sp. TSK TaxID=2925014 RepID=UPI001FC858DA|nr:acyl carrier protein [Desulforhabdus sp. TSK]GKT09067.1 acyl carrier protein [Desulforhabdus sp. TSK]
MSTADYGEILEEVRRLLGRVVKSPVRIEEKTELVNDLGLDSLAALQLVEEVEDAFDISFPLNELSQIRTVRDFVLQIQQEIEA